MFTSRVMTRSLAVEVALALLACTCGAGEPTLRVTEGWVQAVPPVAADSVAYLTIVNGWDHPVRLTSARTPLAEEVIPMRTHSSSRNGHEMMGMERVQELTVAAHGTLKLQPAGPHLMLMRLRTHPRPGTKVQLTLHFEPGARELTTTLPVALTQP